MPRLDGFELARRMREELPQTTIIIISSHTEDSYRALASASGADAFVCKQVLTGSLVPAIHDAVARRASCGDSSPTTSTSSASAGSPT